MGANLVGGCDKSGAVQSIVLLDDAHGLDETWNVAPAEHALRRGRHVELRTTRFLRFEVLLADRATCAHID